MGGTLLREPRLEVPGSDPSRSRRPGCESHVSNYWRLTPAVRDLSLGGHLDGALARADVAGRRPEEAAGLLLLHDVRRPAGDTRASEHRGRKRRWDLRDVEDDRRVVLDIGREHPVG